MPYRFQGQFIKTNFYSDKNIYLFKVKNMDSGRVYKFVYNAIDFLQKTINNNKVNPTVEQLQYLCDGLQGKIKFFEVEKDESPIGKTDWRKVHSESKLDSIDTSKIDKEMLEIYYNLSEYPDDDNLTDLIKEIN